MIENKYILTIFGIKLKTYFSCFKRCGGSLFLFDHIGSCPGRRKFDFQFKLSLIQYKVYYVFR